MLGVKKMIWLREVLFCEVGWFICSRWVVLSLGDFLRLFGGRIYRGKSHISILGASLEGRNIWLGFNRVNPLCWVQYFNTGSSTLLYGGQILALISFWAHFLDCWMLIYLLRASVPYSEHYTCCWAHPHILYRPPLQSDLCCKLKQRTAVHLVVKSFKSPSQVPLLIVVAYSCVI